MKKDCRIGTDYRSRIIEPTIILMNIMLVSPHTDIGIMGYNIETAIYMNCSVLGLNTLLNKLSLFEIDSNLFK